MIRYIKNFFDEFGSLSYVIIFLGLCVCSLLFVLGLMFYSAYEHDMFGLKRGTVTNVTFEKAHIVLVPQSIIIGNSITTTNIPMSYNDRWFVTVENDGRIERWITYSEEYSKRLNVGTEISLSSLISWSDTIKR